MKFYILTFFIISCSAQGKPPIPNSYLASTLIRIVQVGTVSESCFGNETDNGQWKCADCRTAQLCSDTTEVTYKITCADQFPGRPYCDSSVADIASKCVNNPKVCNQDTSKFVCPSIGTYPSLVNCKEYYWCKEEDAEAVKYTCKYNSVYNHEKKDCITNSVCYTVTNDCAKKYKIIPYKLDSNLYVTCRGELPPLLSQCDENLGWDQNLIQCDFICTEEGTFPSATDTKTYYRCTLNGKVLEKETLECADGEDFDPMLKNCVTGASGGL